MNLEITRWVDYWDYLDQNFWGLWNEFRGDLKLEEVAWQLVPTVASIGWNLTNTRAITWASAPFCAAW